MSSDLVPVVSVLGALAGATIVAVTAFRIERRRYRLDRLSRSIDRFCDSINATADLASKYWLLDCTKKADARQAADTEPLLVGRTMRILQLWDALILEAPTLGLEADDSQLLAFIEAVTGGSFQVSNRNPDAGRAATSQSAAAMLNGYLRRLNAR